MRIDDNKEALAMMKRALGSLEAKIREAYNKGYHDGRKDGINQAKREIADKILGDRKDEPQTDELQLVKRCHKSQSLYYRCYCDEREEEEYCNGCEFWHS
jgi:hypothetical protein